MSIFIAFLSLIFLIIPLIVILVNIAYQAEIFFLILSFFTFLIFIKNPVLKFNYPSINLIIYLNLIIFLTAIISFLFLNIDFGYQKFLFKTIALNIILILSLKSVSSIDETSNKLNNFFYVIFLFLLFSSIISGLINTRTHSLYPEISHFALIFGPLIFPIFYFTKIKIKLLLLFFIFLSLYLTYNLIYQVFVLLALLMDYLFSKKENKIKISYYIFILITFSIIYIVQQLDLSYFINYINERIIFTGEKSRQFSLLVYLDGWSSSMDALSHSLFGYGFEQMGRIIPDNIYRQILIDRNFGGLNLYDGSFLFSKLLNEFGIFAILLVFFYFIYFIKFLKIFISRVSELTFIEIYFFNIYFLFFISLFGRFNDILSTNFIMFIIALFYLNSKYNYKKL